MGQNNPSQTYLTSRDYGKLNDHQYEILQEVGKPHIDGFNFALGEGLLLAVQDIPPVEFELLCGTRVCLTYKSPKIENPVIPVGSIHSNNMNIYPSECRQRKISYSGKLKCNIHWSLDGVPQLPIERIIGEVPIMVKSDRCNIKDLSPPELAKHGEEVEEFGGYFVVRGLEKIIRFLIMPRRNYPLVISRPTWRTKVKFFSDLGIQIRCVKPDQTITFNVLHYLTNGTAKLMFSYNRERFYIPVVMMLKACGDVTDFQIYQDLLQGKEEDSYYQGCVTNMLRQVQNADLYTSSDICDYLGKLFRVRLDVPEWYSNAEVTAFLIKNCVLSHLRNNLDKYHLLVFMIKKLFAAVQGECAHESPDNPMFQEVLMAGHLFLGLLKEKMHVVMQNIRQGIIKANKSKGAEFKFTPSAFTQVLSTIIDRGGGGITRPMELLLSTGNLNSKTGLGIMQETGLSVQADKLNYQRYLSHFRAVHRGAFYATMRTTAIRKLLPEAWGFLCPVHTPDGSPCGLLNHMTSACQIVTNQSDTGHMPRLCASLGMTPRGIPPGVPYSECYVVMLDGNIIGWISHSSGANFTHKLRHLKATQQDKVSRFLEIGFVPFTGRPSQYPGIFLFTTPARLMRPVFNLSAQCQELIGTFEQVNMNICLTPEEAYDGITTHQELNETCTLSILANLTPLSDHNQSPRNMYQCQMAKQTMGTPVHNYRQRADNKLYRLLTPQSPLFRPLMYDRYRLDDYPNGFNAVVAVISYTGYDMEDAMIINKASLERGLAHGTMYKTEVIDLSEEVGRRDAAVCFGRLSKDDTLEGKLDRDGLPAVGTFLEIGSPYYSYVNEGTGTVTMVTYKSTEAAYVDDVKLLGDFSGMQRKSKASITLRVQRNPMIGDKFASRHGQKGINSMREKAEDMPFTESGIVPDIIFNPHGFPSRMTIAMMIELMAGKAGALHGLPFDATPFTFSEATPAPDHFGKMLEAAGYNYYGTERMYSGTDGRELEANIFFGVVYYQRLRHMVSDKFQVRTTGTVDSKTHQPVQGRKKGGGIRFGEMERDSLLAHGVSFLLQDRLFNCSDKSFERACVNCGSIVSPVFCKRENTNRETSRLWKCLTCNRSDSIKMLALPYVFRYLVAELACVNIKAVIDIK